MPKSAGELLGAFTLPIILLAALGLYLGGQSVTRPDPLLWRVGAWLCAAGIVALAIPVWKALDRIGESSAKP